MESFVQSSEALVFVYAFEAVDDAFISGDKIFRLRFAIVTYLLVGIL